MTSYRVYFHKVGYFIVEAADLNDAEKTGEELINDNDPTYQWDEWLLSSVEKEFPPPN